MVHIVRNLNHFRTRLQDPIYIKRKLRQAFGIQMIHVFGDSHTDIFADDRFLIHYLGPATAYNLRNPSSSTKAKVTIVEALQNLTIKEPGTKIILVFGEIDCRIHIYNQHKLQKLPIHQIVDSTVDSYASFLAELSEEFPHISIAVLNVLPQGEETNIYHYPYYASRNARMEITKRFNRQLKRICREQQVLYLEVFDQLLTKREERIRAYTADRVHYNKKIVTYIIPLLKKYNWL